MLFCEHGHLPDLAFIEFPVPQDQEDIAFLTQHLPAKRHAGRGGGALAKGAGGHIDSNGFVHVTVAGADGCRSGSGS